MSAREVDVIIIGAGPVGENVADRTRAAGLETVLVERELVGGECSYWACMPSKALLGPGRLLAAARALPGVAEAVRGGLDVAAVLDRRDAFTSHWSDAGQVDWVEGIGAELVRGTGRIAGERTVEVTGETGEVTTLRARAAVVVATGSTALVPDIPGLADIAPWTSREATSAHTVPSRLTVVGGGVVATELASAFASLGSRVTMLVRHEVLGAFEPFARERVTEGLRAAGVDVRTGVDIRHVARTADGVHVTTGDGDIVSDEVLIATGRAPASGDVGLDSVGIAPGGALDVDDTMLVPGTDWLYGVGDVNGRAPLTHQGKYQARAAGDAIAARAAGRTPDDAPWGFGVATADHDAVPQVVFTDPEVAAVGHTAASAADKGRPVRVVDVGFSSVAGAALEGDRDQGAARLVIDRERDVVIGATFVGPAVAELVHAATIAIVGEVPVGRLWHAVPAYPTVSEIWLRLLEALGRPEA
ncbi:NAD(P)/FAD-dependent oxidoreductase [Pseudoclavibacter chungangensis]|uniref:NAD(P)/FAD-dependent oxidoreductase n=1 Tax=Pseudoclavibacter chungangensis TaxID=587635 RepID=A0A7J5C040_9MICO|nr:NAD(P)/FAD-dependent oxidoreductase [Pseudoclavibacter chungangensis]KAB1660269.1 NAD(P)/FAD-dependent oxidoreductase [Pseudoclavibacter chungangensis]NYJ65615.1 dihydrolipoamide dehydrogenase [Pseudoclavibacter chungangensis]